VDRIIVANKSDQIEKKKVSYDEGYNFAKQYGLEFVEVSAMSSANISEAFEIMARKVLKRLDSTPMSGQRLPQTQLQEKKVNTTSNAGCCS
jgi:GTPase SAR1 family protein